MEEEFTKWFELRFSPGKSSDKSIAYSAWLEGKKQALLQPPVIKSVCDCGCNKTIIETKCSECGYTLDA
jgi:hypothetical protein